ncbi:MAG: Gfo/Idh/MocA family oxidoreductase [Armatimonadetes bacterium]|nr:Gfo/Idh/MocA family oxidoreductase [Armatimonadota bacterium]
MGATGELRVGMIGCGGNARGHMARLLRIEGVKIVALADPSESAIAATIEKFPELADVPKFDDYRKMLEQVEMDAVEISTPHVFHYDQIMDSLRSGKHVLCEKPMVCTTLQAIDVVKEVRATGLTMGIAYQRHFMGPYRYCRQKILSGEVGAVNYISAVQSQNWYRGQVPRGTWRSKKALSCGGQLNDSGSHLLDIVLWMTGLEPEQVFAFENNLDAEVDILTAMSVRFSGGGLCTIGVVGHSVNWFEEIAIWCEDATFVIRDSSRVIEWKGSEQATVLEPDQLPGFGDPDLNFVAAIRGEQEIQAPPECGLQVIRLTEAAWKSAETGQPVAVPPVTV